MNLSSFALIITGVLLNAAAQLMLKAGTRVLGVLGFDGRSPIDLALAVGTQPHILGGLTCYVFSVAIWIVALSRVDVMIAYPMLSIGYVVNALLAWHFFGEALTPSRIAGMAIIMVGVWVLARG
jgi:multidrug transporter EmrE-like cation transporter